MIKIKSLILALSLSPLLLSVWQLPNQAQLSSNSPSKGTAGSVSGNNSGAGGFTIFSLPVGTTSGTISVPAAVQAVVNASGQSAVLSLQGGNSTQQQITALVVALASAVVNSTQAKVPGDVLVKIGSGQTQTFSTLAAAIADLDASISSLPANGSVSVQIGNTTIVISNGK